MQNAGQRSCTAGLLLVLTLGFFCNKLYPKSPVSVCCELVGDHGDLSFLDHRSCNAWRDEHLCSGGSEGGCVLLALGNQDPVVEVEGKVRRDTGFLGEI